MLRGPMAARTPLSMPPAPRPKVLVVGGGPFQLDIVRTARELGALVAVVDRDPSAPGLALADHALVIDVVDVGAVVEAARAWGANGVVTAASDAALGAVAAVGEALGLFAVDPDAVRRCRDKLATFEVLGATAMPDTVCVGGLDEARAALERLGVPAVVKPRSAAGGRGVSIVHDPMALEPALARASRYDHAGLGVLVQRFAGGRAVGVEAFFWRGELAAAFVMDDQFVPGFVSPIGHTLPSTLPEEVQARVCADVARFAEALGLRDGPANFDLRLEGGRTVLLEVNARLGGNSITDLVRSTYGVDLCAATVRASLGHAPHEALARTAPAPTAVRLVVARGDGIARVSDALAALSDPSGLVTIDLAARDGERPSLRVDEHAIVGRCIVRAETPERAAERAREIAEEVMTAIRMEPVP